MYPGSHNPPFPFKEKVSEVIIHPMIQKVSLLLMAQKSGKLTSSGKGSLTSHYLQGELYIQTLVIARFLSQKKT